MSGMRGSATVFMSATWRADRSRTGDWSARGTNPLTTSRTDRWSADPNRSSRRSPDSERRSRCWRKFGLFDLGAKALGRANSNLVALDQCWWLHHRVAAINLRRLIALGLDKINGPWMIPATTWSPVREYGITPA